MGHTNTHRHFDGPAWSLRQLPHDVPSFDHGAIVTGHTDTAAPRMDSTPPQDPARIQPPDPIHVLPPPVP
ncbi:hypothetical protein, partial [Streptomyces blattellae]|uniref:hypothetical protein n=1 Tax=Streptomyces blattellae TaxID=2569855 RepID=UPI001E523B23